MAPVCVCAPFRRKGAFRCRVHCAALRSERDSRNSSAREAPAATCLCAHTSHPAAGSFRCPLHRNQEGNRGGRRPLALEPAAHAELLTSLEPPQSRYSCDDSGLEEVEVVAAVDELGISPGAAPTEILMMFIELIVASVPGAAMASASSSVNQENNLPSDAVLGEGSTESHIEGAVRRTSSSDQRMRDVLLANMPVDRDFPDFVAPLMPQARSFEQEGGSLEGVDMLRRTENLLWIHANPICRAALLYWDWRIQLSTRRVIALREQSHRLTSDMHQMMFYYVMFQMGYSTVVTRFIRIWSPTTLSILMWLLWLLTCVGVGFKFKTMYDIDVQLTRETANRTAIKYLAQTLKLVDRHFYFTAWSRFQDFIQMCPL